MYSAPDNKPDRHNLEPCYPVATRLRKNGFYIGCHPALRRGDLDYIYIIAVFAEFSGKGSSHPPAGPATRAPRRKV